MSNPLFHDESAHIQCLDELEKNGFFVLDRVYNTAYLTQLQHECVSHLDQFREAAIQNGVVSHIRSDHILWIDDNLPLAQQHIDNLNALKHRLNRAFYFGIQDIEAHFARYDQGQFYGLHRDNPQQKNGRIISTVFYLHDAWQAESGGQLRLQDKHGQWHVILPEPNRLVVFQSDLLHEVLLSHAKRLSITAWLRRDQHLF